MRASILRMTNPACHRLCTCGLLVAMLASSAAAQSAGGRDDASRSGPAVRQAFSDVAAPIARSTVSILVDGRQVALGVAVSTNGHVLTKASELRGPIAVRTPEGRMFRASIVGCALEHDLAMIRIDGPIATSGAQGSARRVPTLPPVVFDAGEDAEVGRWVATVGPGATPLAVGVISVGRRTIPADVVMGVLLQDHLGGGARVLEVSPAGGASKAGMKAGDVIVRIDDSEIVNREQVTVVLSKRSPGQTIRVGVDREGERIELDIRLVMRPPPSARSSRQNRMGGRLSERRGGFAAVLQHDMVTIDPTQCGSPVVTLDGRVVGLNIARAGRTEAYAVPSAVVAALIPDLIAGKYPPTTNPSVGTTAPATAPTSHPWP